MKRILLVMIAALSATVFAQGAVKPQLALESWLVQMVVKDGQNVEVFEKAQNTKPGQTLEYRVTASNPADKAVSNLTVDLPIPRETAYLEGTATQSSNYTLMASYDNKKSFGSLPLKRKVIREGKTVEEIVRANEYTHLRWVSKVALKQGQPLEFKARVKVR